MKTYTKEEFSQKIYAIEYDYQPTKARVEEYSIWQYINEYLRDTTTTPRGIAPRLFIEEIEEFEEGESTEILHYYIISSWGVGGNYYRRNYEGKKFETEEEAELHLYNLWWEYRHECDNAPIFYNTREEAEAWVEENKKDWEVEDDSYN